LCCKGKKLPETTQSVAAIAMWQIWKAREWYYKNKTCPFFVTISLVCIICVPVFSVSSPVLVVNTSHPNWVNSVAFSPDGHLLASGSGDKTILLWDTRTRRKLKVLAGHAGPVNAVSFSNDGQLLASGSNDGTVRIWKVKTGENIRTFTGHTGAVKAVCFSPRDYIVCSAGYDKTVRIWNITRGKEVLCLTGHKDWIETVAFSPDGSKIASAGHDRNIILWDADTGQLWKSLSGHQDLITSVDFSPAGNILCSSSRDGTIRIWDWNRGVTLKTMGTSGKSIECIKFASDDQHIFSAGQDHTVTLWDVVSAQKVKTIGSHEATAVSLALHPTKPIIVSGGRDNLILEWDLSADKKKCIYGCEPTTISRLALSSGGDYLVAGLGDNSIRVWNLVSGRQEKILSGHSDWIETVAFSPDGKTIASGSLDRSIKVWDICSGKEKYTLAGHKDSVQSLVFSPDGKILASVSQDKTIKLWDVSSGQRMCSLSSNRYSPLCVAFHPSGEYFATGDDRGNISIYKTATPALQKVLQHDKEAITTLVFSPDGRWLATGSSGHSPVILWDFSSGRITKKMSGHQSWLESLFFSSDGNTLCAACDDHLLYLWNVASGRLIKTLAGHSNSVRSAILLPGNSLLVSGSRDGTIRFWDVVAGKNTLTINVFRGRDWVIVNGQGEFDGSPNGIANMHYVLDESVIPFESLTQQCHFPGILSTVSKLQITQMPVPGIDFLQKIKLPPLVEILSPPDGTVTDQPDINITVKATDCGGGVAVIRLYHNGKLVAEKQRRIMELPTTRQRTEKFMIELSSGVNQFQAIALNEEGTESLPATISVIARRKVAPCRLFVISVGINEYPNAADKLKCAQADALAFSQAVQAGAKPIFSEVDIQSLFDHHATRKGIESAFEKVCASARPQDVFIFFFAGHGLLTEESSKPGQFYLAPSDVDRLSGFQATLKEKGISAEQLLTLSVKVPARKQLLILDCCDAAGVLRPFRLRGPAEARAIAQLARSSGVAIIASSGPGEAAIESSELGHGIFTYALLEGMKGKADTNQDRQVTVLELMAFLHDIIPQLSEKYRGLRQYPHTFSRSYDEGGYQDFPIVLRQ